MFQLTNNGIISVANGIPDQLENNSFTSSTINLNGVFSYSGANTLGYTVSIADTSVVTASIVGTSINLTEKGIETTKVTP